MTGQLPAVLCPFPSALCPLPSDLCPLTSIFYLLPCPGSARVPRVGFRVSRKQSLKSRLAVLWGAQAASLKRQSGIGLQVLAETSLFPL